MTLFKLQRPYRRKIVETFKDFTPTVLALLDMLLAIEPSARGTVASALDSEWTVCHRQFFKTKQQGTGQQESTKADIISCYIVQHQSM